MTSMYAEDHDGSYPKSNLGDVWLVDMMNAGYFRALEVFKDPADVEGPYNLLKFRMFRMNYKADRSR